MKTLIANKNEKFDTYKLGLCNAFEQHGQVTLWNKQTRPAFDMFSSEEPDIFIDDLESLDRATKKCIKARPQLKAYIRIPDNQANLFSEQEEIAAEIPNLKFIGSNDSIKEDGKLINFRYGADHMNFFPGNKREEFRCELVYIGNYRPDKMESLQEAVKGVKKFKIFGNEPWPLPQYLGSVSLDLMRDIYASAERFIDIRLPGQTFVNEKFYQAIVCGCNPGFSVNGEEMLYSDRIKKLL